MNFNRPSRRSSILTIYINSLCLIVLIMGLFTSYLLTEEKFKLEAIRHKAACTYCTTQSGFTRCRLLWHDEPDFKKTCKIFFKD
jgi:hypothetical protein